MRYLPTSRVSDVLSESPGLIDVFRRFGFSALSNPVLRATLARKVTIDEACQRHRVRTEEFLKALEDATDKPPRVELPPARPVARPDASSSPGEWVQAFMSTGECVGKFPETRAVFAGYFGEGCFSCPAFGGEDLYTACMMHGTPVEEFVAACNRAVSEKRGPTPAKETKEWVSAGMTVSDILRNYPEAAPVIAHYGIDSCCGGTHPLEFTCRKHGLDLGVVMSAIDSAIQANRSAK